MLASPHAKVYVAAVSEYGRPELDAALRRAFEHVGPQFGETILIQSDWSGGNRRLTPAASTRFEVVAGVLGIALDGAKDAVAILGGRGALEVPGRRGFSRVNGDGMLVGGGFRSLRRRFGKRLRLQPGDESRLYRYQLSVGDLLRADQRRDLSRVLPLEERASQRVVAGSEFYHAHTVVLSPKLRYAVELGGLSGAVALLGLALPRPEDRDIGGQRVRHHRMSDLLEIGDPDLIVSDGIEIGWGGGSLCQSGRPMGVIVVADNAVAHDAVCSRMLGLQPEEMPHLVTASSRGYGAFDEGSIDLVTEVDFQETALRARGFGVPRVRSPGQFRAWYQRRTGFALGLEVLDGGDPDVGSRARTLGWLMACWDHPETREAMKSWPDFSMMVGVNEEGPRHLRVALLGDRAIADFPRHCVSMTAVFDIPQRLRRSLGGIAGLHHFRRRDGRAGWAIAVPGTPPSLREISVALRLFTLGAVRSPLLKLEGPLDRLLFRFLAFLRRRRRNSSGLPVVHARKIARLRERSWRRLWAQPSRLRLRGETGSHRPVQDEGGAA